MAKKRHTPEQVINKVREAEVAIAEDGWYKHRGQVRIIVRFAIALSTLVCNSLSYRRSFLA